MLSSATAEVNTLQEHEDNPPVTKRAGIFSLQNIHPKENLQQKEANEHERHMPINPIINNLQVHESIYVDKVKVRFVKESCYWCKTEHYVYILIGAVSDKFPALASTEVFQDYGNELNEFDPVVVNGVKRFLSKHPELNYNMGDIKKRYNKTRNEEYITFGCPKCDGMVGDWYLNEIRVDYLYEPDDDNVHVIELEEPMKQEYLHK